MIREMRIEREFSFAYWFSESLIQVIYKFLASTHQRDQICRVVLYIPAVDPAIIFSIVVTCSHATGEAVVKRVNKVSFAVPGVEKSGFSIIYIAVGIGNFHKLLVFVIVSECMCYLCQTPSIVTIAKHDRDSLATFETMYTQTCFFFTRMECGEVSVLLIERIEFR